MFKQRPSSLRSTPTESGIPGPTEDQTLRHWQQRLFKNSYTRAGRRFTLKRWSVKIQHAGRRHTFSLAARTKSAAAAEAKAIHEAIIAEGWDAVLRRDSFRVAGNGDFPKTDPRHWRQRLLLRRHPFPAVPDTAEVLTARIEHAGITQLFPLGTTDLDAAAGQAQRIYQTIVEQGWAAACRAFPREVTIGFEWSTNPVLWTYTTIHTLLKAPASSGQKAPTLWAEIQRVLLLESDPGISRALGWILQQQAGVEFFSCDSEAFLLQALERQQPQLILANHLLAEHWGLTADSKVTAPRPQATIVTYSSYADSDHLFLATPGGAGVYLLNRVEPASLLAPILSGPGHPDPSAEDLPRRVQSYFKGLLQPPATRGTGGLAQLTRRERDVLALLSKGYIDKEIAPALGISTWTVRGHIKKIFERLNVHTRTEAVVQYLEK